MSKAEREALARVVAASKRVVQRVPLRPDPLDEIQAMLADEEGRDGGRGPR